MKNSIKFCLLLTLSTILFTACGSSRSMTKKHYNDRYYIGMSKKENSRMDHDVAKTDDETTITTENTKEKIETESTIIAVTTENETVPVEANKISLNEKEELSNKTNNDESETENNSINKSTDKDSPSAFEKKNTKIKVTEFPYIITKKIENTKDKMSTQSAEGDAYSLLWIVIIVLLILWALGWLAGGLGLGNVIHVLLIIALILLILWLLRIL